MQYKKLGEICEIVNGFAFKSELYKSEGVKIIRITNVQKGFISDNDPQYYSLKEFEGLERYALKENDLLMSLTGNVGRVGLIPKSMLPAGLNQRVACLKPNEQMLYKKYLFHILNSYRFENDAIYNSKGIAQKNMSTEWLKIYEVPVPSLATQSRIVSELDLLTSLIDNQKKQLDEFNKLQQSTFYSMFGDPVENEKKWPVKKLGECVTEVRYGTSKSSCSNGKYKYLRMNNITYDGNLDLRDLKTIDIPDEEIEKCIVRKGDILFNRTNSLDLIGKTCMFNLDEPMVIAGYIIRVRLMDFVMPLYVSKLLNTPVYKNIFKSMAKGAVNQANINAKELQSITLPLPPLSLQTAFAEKISAIEEMKKNLRASIAETQKMFDARMQEIFG